MASWGCPHEIDGVCQKVNQMPCDPGMRGCVLYGRFVFSNPAKNRPARPDPRNAAEGNAERQNSPAPSPDAIPRSVRVPGI